MGDLERALSRNTLLTPALAVSLGVASGLKLNLSWIYGFGLLLLAALLYIILLKRSTNAIKTYRLRNYHQIWFFIAFCGLGIMSSFFRAPGYLELPVDGTECIVTGKVSDIKEQTSGDVLILDVSDIYSEKSKWYNGNNMIIKANLRGSGGQLEVGDEIRFKAALRLIEDNPNSFIRGYKSMMNAKGIYYHASINAGNIKIIRNRHTLKYYSNRIRNSIERCIENTTLSKSTQNFLITLLLGDRSYLDPELKATFADAGVSHVLALSGMHIAIIGGIFLMLLFPFNFYGRYKWRYAIATLLLWFYTFISGMAPSTIRACIMITFMTISLLSERKNYAINALSASVIIVLLVSPQTLFDVGFQLSVVCVASLILFTGHLNLFSHRSHPRLYRFMETLSATFVATFASWILTCYYFHSFPLSFMPANMILLPILPIYLIIAIIYIALSSLGIDFAAVRCLLDRALEYFSKILDGLGGGNTLEITVSYEAVIFWICGLVAIASFLNVVRWKPILVCGLLSLCLSIFDVWQNKQVVQTGSFIVCNTYNTISLTVKQPVKEKRIEFERYSNSGLKVGDRHIICIDAAMERVPDNINCDYLIIGGGFKGDLEELVRAIKPRQIIIHKSVRRKREAEYIRLLESIGIKFHSLRNNSSFTREVV